jgi:hypothetical protein
MISPLLESKTEVTASVFDFEVGTLRKIDHGGVIEPGIAAEFLEYDPENHGVEILGRGADGG